MACINTKHPEFIKLQEETGIKSEILSTKIASWQEKHKVERFPTSNELHRDFLDNSIPNEFTSNLDNKTQAELEGYRKRKIKNLLNQRINKLEDIRSVVRSKDTNQFLFFDGLIKDLKEKRVDIRNIKSLEDLIPFAEYDLQEIDKILSKKKSTYEEIVYGKKILSNWMDVYSLYFTTDEYKFSSQLIDQFTPIVKEANKKNNQLLKALEKVFESHIKQETGKDIDLNSVMSNMRDIPFADKYGYDISRFNITLFSHIHLQNSKAFQQTKIETYDKLKSVDKLIEDIIPKLEKDKHGKFSIFFRKYKDGSLANELVSPFIKEYEDAKKYKIQDIDNASDEYRGTKIKEFSTYLNKNAIVFNPYLLFEADNNKARENHINELKQTLGEPIFNFLYQVQKEHIIRYKEQLNNEYENLKIRTGLEDIDKIKENFREDYDNYMYWVKTNSPYEFYKQIQTGETSSLKILDKSTGDLKIVYPSSNGYDYLVDAPLNKENYDENFQQILNDKELLNFYNEYNKTLKELSAFLPEKVERSIRFGGLPEIKKGVLEALNEEGLKGAGAFVKENIYDQITTEEDSEFSDKDVDSISGEEYEYLKFNLVRNHDKAFKELLARRNEENKFKENPEKDFKVRQDAEKEFNNLVANRNTKDLGKLLRAYVGLSLTYKYKSRVQDIVLAGEMYLNSLKEPDTTRRGVIKKTGSELSPESKYKPKVNSHKHLKDAYAHYLESFFNSPYAKEGVTNKKILNREDKKTKTELLDLVRQYEQMEEEIEAMYASGEIEESIYKGKLSIAKEKQEYYKQEADKLGSNVTASEAGNLLLKITQLRGMGWNVLAGVGNMGFGVTALYTEAADGREFNEKELNEYMKMVSNSFARNASFNRWGGKNNLAVKIRNLMDRGDIMKEASHELFGNSVKGTFNKKLRFLHPYNMQKRTEYIIQAPIMIHFYKKMTFKDKNGDTVTLWDAFDENGEFNTEKHGKEPLNVLIKANVKATELIKRIHGNYDPISTMLLKKNFAGRALGQFKTWIFESYSRRWGKYDYSEVLDRSYQGYYTTIPEYFKNKEGGYIMGVLDIAKSLALRTLAGKRVSLDEKNQSELVNANMRKALTELAMFIQIAGVTYLMKFLFEDDEEENKVKDNSPLLNLFLNKSSAVQEELLMWANPVTLYEQGNNIAPVLSTINDTKDLIISIKKAMEGENEIKYGTFSGQKRTTRALYKLFPFTTQIRSFDTYSETLIGY